MKSVAQARVLRHVKTVPPNANRAVEKQSWTARALAIVALVSATSRGVAGASFVSLQGATTAQAQGNATIRHGILILAVPTLVLFALIVAIVYKKRNVSR